MSDTRFKAENGLLVAGDAQLTSNVEVGGVLFTTDGGFLANSSIVKTLHPLTIANSATAQANLTVIGTLTGNAIAASSVDSGSLLGGNAEYFVSANTTELVVANVSSTFENSNVTIEVGSLELTSGDLTVNGSSHTISGNVDINQGQFVFQSTKNLFVEGGTITMEQTSGDVHALEISMASENSGPLRIGANAISFNWDETSNSSLSNTSYPYATLIAHDQTTGALTVSSGANSTSSNGALDVVDTITFGRTATTVNTELVTVGAATFSNTVVVNGSQLTANALVVKGTTTAQANVTFEASATMNVDSFFQVGNSSTFTRLTSVSMVVANSTTSAYATPATFYVGNNTSNTTITSTGMVVGNTANAASWATTVANGYVYVASTADSVYITPENIVAGGSTMGVYINKVSAKFLLESEPGGVSNATVYSYGMETANSTFAGEYKNKFFSVGPVAANESMAIVAGDASTGSLKVTNAANSTQQIAASAVGNANVMLRVSHATTNTIITPTDIQIAANTSTRTVTNSTAFSVVTGTTTSNSIVAAFTANATGYPLVSFTSGSANVLLGTAGLTMGNSTSNATVNQTGLWFNGTGIGLANVSIDGSTGTLNLGVSTIYGSGWATFNGNTALGLPFGNTATRPTINRTAYLRYNTETDQLEVSNNASWNYVVTSSGAGKASVTAVANTIVQRNTTADIYANNFYSTSDVTLKQNLVQITGALDKLEQITGWMYNFIGDDKTQLGVSAQQVEKTIPEVVGTNEQGLKSVSYQMLIPVIIESIKELKQKLDEITDGGKNKPRN